MINQPANNDLVIGLPIRNEAARLPGFLASLSENIAMLKAAGRKTSIIACINGTTDHSEAIIDAWNARQTDKAFRIKVIKSSPGKFTAVREIAKYANEAALAFVDVDIVMAPDCLLQLSSHLDANPLTHIAYANGEPVIPSDIPDTPFLITQRDYYAARKALPKRNFLHGRTFMMRSNAVLIEDLCVEDRVIDFVLGSGDSKKAASMSRILKLMDGPLADDIYVSYAILKRYGVGSIRQVDNACVKYTPSLTKVDFWRYCRRMELEKLRLACLFPDFGDIEKTTMNRDMSGKKVITTMRVSGSLEKRANLAAAVKTLAKENPIGLAQLTEVWVPTSSTKTAFAHAKSETASGLRVPPSPVRKVEIALLPEDAELPEGANITAALALVLDEKGNILSIVNKRGFDIPGGHVEPGEDVVGTLHRELMEEASATMLHPTRVGIFRSVNYPKTGDVSYMLVYAGQLDQLLPFQPSVPNEIVARNVMPIHAFLDCYTAGDEGQMATLIKRAEQYIPNNVIVFHRNDNRTQPYHKNGAGVSMPVPNVAAVMGI